MVLTEIVKKIACVCLFMSCDYHSKRPLEHFHFCGFFLPKTVLGSINSERFSSRVWKFVWNKIFWQNILDFLLSRRRRKTNFQSRLENLSEFIDPSTVFGRKNPQKWKCSSALFLFMSHDINKHTHMQSFWLFLLKPSE